jgi:hypothetical protein
MWSGASMFHWYSRPDMVKALKVAGGELKFTAQPGAGPDGNQSGCDFIKGVYIDDPIGIADSGWRCRR